MSGLVNGRITPEGNLIFSITNLREFIDCKFEIEIEVDTEDGLTKERWEALHSEDGVVKDDNEVYRLVYFGGVQHDIRKDVWPYLLGHYRLVMSFCTKTLCALIYFKFLSFGSSAADRLEVDETTRHCYEQKVGAWLAVEAIVRQLDKEKTAHAVAKLSSESSSDKHLKASIEMDGDIENDVFEENCFSDLSDPEDYDEEHAVQFEAVTDAALSSEITLPAKPSRVNKSSTDSGNVPDEDVQKCDETDNVVDEIPIKEIVSELSTTTLALDITENCFAEPSEDADQQPTEMSNKSSPSTSSYETVANDFGEMIESEMMTIVDEDVDAQPMIETITHHSVFITNASIDIVNVLAADEVDGSESENMLSSELAPLQEEIASLETLQEPKSACVSPASSGGGVYSVST